MTFKSLLYLIINVKTVISSEQKNNFNHNNKDGLHKILSSCKKDTTWLAIRITLE